SLCAEEQGKFWQMHDAMFKDQSALAVDRLKATAAGLGLDPAAFNSCLDSGRQAEKVAADFQAGRKAGVDSTPTLFVNGRMLVGPPAAALAAVVAEELARISR